MNLAPSTSTTLPLAADPESVAAKRPPAKKPAARPHVLRGLGSGWVVSIAVHALLAWGATHYLLTRVEVEPPEAPATITSLDLRAMNLVERAAQTPVFDARPTARAGVPEPVDEPLVDVAPALTEGAAATWSDFETEVVPPYDHDVDSAPGAIAGAGASGSVRGTKLPGRRAAPVASGPVAGGGGSGEGSGSGGAGDGASGSTGVPGGTGTAAIVAPLPPKLVDGPEPPYPALARRAGQEGRVELRISIDATGRVTDVAVTKSSGHERLDEAARAALAAWRFEPATHGGVAIACKIDHAITFRLVRD